MISLANFQQLSIAKINNQGFTDIYIIVSNHASVRGPRYIKPRFVTRLRDGANFRGVTF